MCTNVAHWEWGTSTKWWCWWWLWWWATLKGTTKTPNLDMQRTLLFLGVLYLFWCFLCLLLGICMSITTSFLENIVWYNYAIYTLSSRFSHVSSFLIIHFESKSQGHTHIKSYCLALCIPTFLFVCFMPHVCLFVHTYIDKGCEIVMATLMRQLLTVNQSFFAVVALFDY